jgi:hypothetical protein
MMSNHYCCEEKPISESVFSSEYQGSSACHGLFHHMVALDALLEGIPPHKSGKKKSPLSRV